MRIGYTVNPTQLKPTDILLLTQAPQLPSAPQIWSRCQAFHAEIRLRSQRVVEALLHLRNEIKTDSNYCEMCTLPAASQ